MSVVSGIASAQFCRFAPVCPPFAPHHIPWPNSVRGRRSLCVQGMTTADGSASEASAITTHGTMVRSGARLGTWRAWPRTGETLMQGPSKGQHPGRRMAPGRPCHDLADRQRTTRIIMSSESIDSLQHGTAQHSTACTLPVQPLHSRHSIDANSCPYSPPLAAPWHLMSQRVASGRPLQLRLQRPVHCD